MNRFKYYTKEKAIAEKVAKILSGELVFCEKCSDYESKCIGICLSDLALSYGIERFPNESNDKLKERLIRHFSTPQF